MYTAGILPVAQQKFTCTVITTTPGPAQSYIMQQAKKVDLQGNPMMPCLLLGEPCVDCKAKNEYICPHTTEKGPFWKSAAKRSAFGFFYESDKETDAMVRTIFCFSYGSLCCSIVEERIAPGGF
jgi:hypothetical protein